MANTIKVGIDCYAPHENAPEFVKGTTTFILSDEDFRKIEDYKRACNGNGKENYIPLQVKETKTGKNMLFLDAFKLEFQTKQVLAGATPVAEVQQQSKGYSKPLRDLEEEITIADIPF